MEEIPESEINAMCLTWRHDFGLPYSASDAEFYGITGPTPGERQALQAQMRQIYRHHVLPAILAERERCAKVADDMEALSVDSSEWDAGYRCALDAVAAAIRSGVHP